MESNRKKITDYLFILYKWRNFLLIILFLFIAAGFSIAFLTPNQYKARATITLPTESGLGGLSALIGNSNSPLTSFGSKLFGLSSSNEDLLLGILYSRNSLVSTIKKFNLMQYYEVRDNNMDKVIRAFKGDISFEPDEYGLIEISVINKDPQMSAKIANYFVELLDSLNIQLNTTQARNNRIFIQKRYEENLSDLKTAEDSMYLFQKKYGVIAAHDQLQISVEAAAEIEAELVETRLKASLIKNQIGANSPLYISFKEQADKLQQKVDELKNAKELSTPSNILFPFKEMPYLTMRYVRYYRQIKIQQDIMDVLLPLYEQAKIEEQKSIPTIMVVNKAVPPQIKDSPKRSFIILLFFFLGSFLVIPIIFIGERVLINKESNNTIETFQYNFFRKIRDIFHLRL